MNIGLDVDGVLVDVRTFQLREGKRYFQKKYGISIKNPDMFEVQDVFECTKKQRESFWIKYIWKYCLKEPMTEDAAEVVNSLREEGHRIVIITSRVHTTETGITGKLFRWMLRHWLRKNHMTYDDIIFCEEKGSGVDKLRVCKENNIDVMVDDSPENLYEIRKNNQVICYTAAWNLKCHDLDACRVNSFKELHAMIHRKLEEKRMVFNYEGTDNYEKVCAQIEQWITTPKFVSLLHAYGYEETTNQSLQSRVESLIKFSDKWDFRAMQGSARWEIAEQEMENDMKKLIFETATTQGLKGCVAPAKREYDYIFVLGGARMSCMFRMKYAKEICDTYNLSVKNIVGLAGMRPIMDSERNATDTYAPHAKTEFDLMRAAMNQVYGSVELQLKKEDVTSNLNESWAIEEYRFKDREIALLAAPSKEPEKRRANTADTFSFFMEEKQVKKGKTILLITSQIYVPYQQLEAVRILGMPYSHSIETVGFTNEWSLGLQGLQKPENYLQEMRSVLQSAGRILSINQ